MCILGDNDWCTRKSPCFTCAEMAHDRAHPEPVDVCLTCRLRSVQLSPAATPSKTRRLMKPGARRDNAWERGIVRDARGMPMLDGLAPIGTKQYAQNRSTYEARRRDLANAPESARPQLQSA